jgi:hypothetical protein
MFGIEGAEGPRPLRDNEVVQGSIVAEFTDKAGHEQYVVETDQNAYVAIPKEAAADFSVGDSIEATRAGSAYEITAERDYGM